MEGTKQPTARQVYGIGQPPSESRAEARLDQLQDELHLLRTLVDLVPDFIYAKDTAGCYLLANMTEAKWLGVESPQALIGKTDFDFYPQHIARQFYENEQRVIQSGVPAVDLEEILDDQGTRIYISSTQVPLRDRSGRVIGLVGISRDITARKQAEEALRESKRLNELRLQALVSLYQMADAPLQELMDFALDAAIELTGSQVGYFAFVNEDETLLTMQSWSKVALEQCRLAEKPLVYRVEETGLWGEALRQRRPIITNDYASPDTPWKKGYPEGHVPIIRHMNLPVFDGDHVVIVAGVGNKATDYDDTDVTQLSLLMTGMWQLIRRKRAIEASQESQRMLLTLMSNLPGMAYRCRNDPDWTMEFVSEGCLALTGYPPEDLLGNRRVAFNNLIHPEDRAHVWNEVQTALKEHRPYQCVYRIITADGDERWVWEQGCGVGRGDGPAMMLEGFIADISRQKKAEEENARLQAQLAQAQRMQALGRLTAGIAHDFNNLLTAINGFSELMRDQLPTDDPLRPAADNILRAGQRAADLIRQLLAFSRKQVIELRPLNINRVVTGMEALLRRILGEHIRLECHLDAQLGTVKGDASQIEQVLTNLVVNARDAMPDGGLLTIETANVVLDQAYVAGHFDVRPGEYVMLAISDTGCGIPPEVMPHLFEPFFTTKADGLGTGLGLATVYGIVKQNGGHVSAYSEVGVGTTFKVYLPRTDSPEISPPSAELRSGSTSVGTGDETVLLAEDNDDVRRIVQSTLERFGYRVLAASNAQQALQLAAQHPDPIQLLLTDVVLPDLNGKLLAERLRELRPATAVLYMSGYTDNVIVHHGVLEPGIEFLQKPFSPDQLAAKIRSVLDRAHNR